MAPPARRRSTPGRESRGGGGDAALVAGWPAATAALLSFAVCAAATLLLCPVDDVAVAAAATLPHQTAEWPLVAHAMALIMAAVLKGLQRSRSTAARHTGILCYISTVSTLAAALHVHAPTKAVRIDAFGTLARPLRIVAWLHSTPAMLLLIAELAGASPHGAGAAIALDVGMLLSGLVAETTPAPVAHVFAGVSLLLLPLLLWSLHTMFMACLARTPRGAMRARALAACRAASLGVWASFAAIFVASANGVLSHRAAAWAWAAADVGAKACFAFTLLHSNTVTLDEAAAASWRAAADAKQRQVAQLCHEIRNPLNGILGNLQELDVETAAASVGVAALVTTTLTCTSQLRRTLDDFLDLAKADSAALRVVRGPARLRPLLGDVARQVLRAAHDKGLTVRVHVPRALAARVFLLDGGRVQQILANYAWNACKFTPSGGITLRVRIDDTHDAASAAAHPGRADGGSSKELIPVGATCGELPLVFEVSDTGAGISPEAQARLFQPFEQAHTDGAGGSKWGGTGLGLSICKVMGELLGGTVGATSMPGTGSTFWLRLPAEWYSEPGTSGGGTGTDSGELVADRADEARAAAAGVVINPALRQRRGAAAAVAPPPPPRTRATVDEADAPAAAAAFSGRILLPRRHSLDGWSQQARYALGSPQQGARPGARRAPGSMDSGSGRPFASMPPAAGSLAAQLAAVAAAHAAPGAAAAGGAAAGSATAGVAVSNALVHAVRTLREALDDAEVAVAWRLGDPSEWMPAERLSGSRESRSSGRPSIDLGAPFPAAPAAAAAAPALVPAASTSPPPAAPPAAAALAVAATAAGSPRWPGPLRSVLVVDDEPVNTALVARRLKREAPDVAVTLADDGTEMVRLTVDQRRRYDVVLMDQHMRGMNGDAAVAALRAHETTEGLPRSLVLACTGNACAPDLALFAQAGFDGVITKPLDMCSLVPTLAALLRDPHGGAAAALDNVHIFPGPTTCTSSPAAPADTACAAT